MKMNIIITLIVAGLLAWGVYSLTHVNEGWEVEQGWFLIGFALAVGVVLYFATRPRIGR